MGRKVLTHCMSATKRPLKPSQRQVTQGICVRGVFFGLCEEASALVGDSHDAAVTFFRGNGVETGINRSLHPQGSPP